MLRSTAVARRSSFFGKPLTYKPRLFHGWSPKVPVKSNISVNKGLSFAEGAASKSISDGYTSAQVASAAGTRISVAKQLYDKRSETFDVDDAANLMNRP